MKWWRGIIKDLLMATHFYLNRLYREPIHLLIRTLCWNGEAVGRNEETQSIWKVKDKITKEIFRCDQKADCEDQSDEASCQIVHLNPEQYLKESISFQLLPSKTKQFNTWVLKVHQPKKTTKISFQGINSYCSHDSESVILKSGA